MRGWITDKTYRKNEQEDGKLKIGGGSWTINLQEIYGKPINRIEYITPKAIYSIDYQEAVSVGFVRTFQGEAKLIVPIKYWQVKFFEEARV